LAGLRDHQYSINGWVVYGRDHPTPATRTTVRQELRHLVLPQWPRWH
jgi:hypothetical protein